MKVETSVAAVPDAKVEVSAPPPFRTPHVTAPGAVQIAALAAMENDLFEASAEPLTDASICNWKPNRAVIRERGFTCTNTVLRNPESRALEPCCGWHAKGCVLSHTYELAAGHWYEIGRASCSERV